MKMIKREITTYDVGGGFYVDVATDIDDANITEFYLYHAAVDVKSYMFGIVGNCEIEELILANVDEYIELYKEDYF